MEANDDFLGGNAHFCEGLVNFNVGIVLLEPDFAVFEVEMKNAVVNPLGTSPTHIKQEVAIVLFVENKLNFDFWFWVLGPGFCILLQECFNAGAMMF